MPTTSLVPVRLARPANKGRSAAVVSAIVGLAWCAGGSVLGQAVAPSAPAADAAEDALPAAQRLKLSTSDGVGLAAWFYPAAQAEPESGEAASAPPPVVILLHDLGGSHESVEPLAQDLQGRGIAVVAPDLRGHGATTVPEGRGGSDAKSLKKPDFDNMAMTGGGRVRAQADRIGDVEAVRNWIEARGREGKLDVGRLVVVGSGVGAAVAALWTNLDANWPDLASGPQGRQVRGLVLVSPAWTTRGFAIGPALAVEPVRKTLPVLVIAGTRDTDAVKLYEQLKKQRPESWSEKRAGQAAPTQAPKLGEKGTPSLYLRQFDTGIAGDRLAAFVPKGGGGGHPAAIVAGFLNAVTATEQ